jgi:hypothetical protein
MHSHFNEVAQSSGILFQHHYALPEPDQNISFVIIHRIRNFSRLHKESPEQGAEKTPPYGYHHTATTSLVS